MTEQFLFGYTPSGEAVEAVRLTNRAGVSAVVLSYGATLQSLLVPNAAGGLTDVVLGYDAPAGYEEGDAFLGATIGRFANRIGGAAFSLNGQTHRLAKNNGENHLHGGPRGFHRQLWALEAEENAAVCRRISPDGEESYPGELRVELRYTLREDSTLCISYDALSSADTLVNLTNHSYFNLAGDGSILGHRLQINAERYLENDSGCLPTGRLLSVESSPFDFRREKEIGRDIDADHEQLKRGGGYDHCYVLSGSHAAGLYCPDSGIRMDVFTDLPGMQLYSSNALPSQKGKGGREMGKYSGLCLETQLFPNAMRCWGFPSPVLRAGVPLHTESRYAFSVAEL